jgi:hypothetical protein
VNNTVLVKRRLDPSEGFKPVLLAFFIVVVKSALDIWKGGSAITACPCGFRRETNSLKKFS